jgi:hypothetical protein
MSRDTPPGHVRFRMEGPNRFDRLEIVDQRIRLATTATRR